MNKPVVVIVLALAALAAWKLTRPVPVTAPGTVPGPVDTAAPYRLLSPSELREREVPTPVFVALKREDALSACWADRRDVRQRGDECAALVERNHEACAQGLAAAAPGTVPRGDAQARLVRDYLACVNPVRYGHRGPG